MYGSLADRPRTLEKVCVSGGLNHLSSSLLSLSSAFSSEEIQCERKRVYEALDLNTRSCALSCSNNKLGKPDRCSRQGAEVSWTSFIGDSAGEPRLKRYANDKSAETLDAMQFISYQLFRCSYNSSSIFIE